MRDLIRYYVSFFGLPVIFLLAACAADPTSTPLPVDRSLASTAALAVPTVTPVGTPSAAVLPDLSGMSARTINSISPDRQWRAEALLAFLPGEPPYEYAQVTVSRTDESETWVPYELLSEGGFLGAGYISDFYWSADGQYVYFEHSGISDGCGYPFTTELHRVDLSSGSLRQIPLTDMEFGEITVSPGADRMAYKAKQGIQLVGLGEESSLSLPYQWPQESGSSVVWNAWSPDGQELAFSVTERRCDTFEPTAATIQVIDLNSGAIRAPNSDDTWLYLPAQVSVDLIPSAALALQDFLSSLYWGGRGGQAEYTYDRAAALYGGSYETLIDMNPDIDPDEHVSLLRYACEFNGFQCLRLRDVISSSVRSGQGGAQEVRFTVYLADPSDEIFALGPCCGEEGGLPQAQFNFTVVQSGDGTFKVLELPPYMP